MIRTRFLWLSRGRDIWWQGRRWSLYAIWRPRRDLTGDGFLVAGYHIEFTIDWVDFDFHAYRVEPTIGRAA